MPKVVWSEETLNGQEKICSSDKRTGYYLRIYRKEKRSYSYPSLSTSDIQEARKNALNVYIETTKVAPKTRSKKYLLKTAVEEYLLERQEDVRNNELSAGSPDTYRQRLSQRIVPYALEKGVRNIGDLTNKTWDDYKRFYQSRTTAGRWVRSHKDCLLRRLTVISQPWRFSCGGVFIRGMSNQLRFLRKSSELSSVRSIRRKVILCSSRKIGNASLMS